MTTRNLVNLVTTVGMVSALAACTVKFNEQDDAAAPTAGAAGTGGSGAGGSAGSSGANPDSQGTGGTGAADGGVAATAGSGGSNSPEAGTTAADGAAAIPGDASFGLDDPCTGTEPTPNNDRATATKIPVNAPIKGCIQAQEDVDFFEFTTPADPAQGGFVQVQVTDVATAINIKAVAYSAHDNGQIVDTYSSTNGASVFLWFAAVPAATYRVAISEWNGAVKAPAPYVVTAKFTGVPDANEPNDDLDHASLLTPGVETSGYFFAGYLDSTRPSAVAWDDFYKVTLTTAPVTITVKPPSDINAHVELRDGAGAVLQSEYSSTVGSSVVLTDTPKAAGVHYVVVSPFTTGALTGTGSTVPVFFGAPYKVSVAQ